MMLFHKKLQVHIVEKLRKPQFKMKTAWIPQFMLWDFHDYHAGVVYTASICCGHLFYGKRRYAESV